MGATNGMGWDGGSSGVGVGGSYTPAPTMWFIIR